MHLSDAAIERHTSFNLMKINKKLLALVLTLFGAAGAVQAQTITPITWNMVGLDSNNVTVGPNVFPVGARICNNTGSSVTNWQAKFNWVGTTSTYITRTSPEVLDVGTLAANACQDVFHEVTITRNAAAYDQRAQYNIEVVAAGVPFSPVKQTPTNREIYVERLISQNRNAVSGYSYNGTTVNPGASITIQTGQTFDLELRASTATQGYEQLEKFITLSPAYFKVNKITSTYSANAGTDPNAANKLYADGCGWQNDITANTGPWQYHNNYSCSGTGKYGGTITQKYNVTVLAAPSSGSPPNVAAGALIYDFSGSSYHYNSDYSSGGINFVWGTPTVPDSADVSILKTAYADTGGGNQRFDITVTNQGPGTATNVVVTDVVPSGYSIDNNQSWTSAADSDGVVQVGNTITWTVGTMTPNSTATLPIKVNRLNSGNYLNTASVNCATIDPDCSNNSSTAQIADATADLAITKIVQKTPTTDKTPPKVGEVIKFIIKVTNTGPSTATGVAVNDAIPSGYTVGTVTPSAGTSWSSPTWTIGSLALNATATLEVSATVNATGTYVNQATVSSTTNDPNTGNNTATADATPTYLSLTKTSGSSTLAAGATGTFTVTASKTGPANLGTITVSDIVPAGMTLQSMAGSGWTCNVSTKQCTRADEYVSPASGAYPAITVTVSVSANQPTGTLTNYSSVTSSAMPSSYAEATSSVAVTDLVPYPDVNATFVDVAVTGSVATNDKGSAATYTPITDPVQSPTGSSATLSMGSNGTYTFTANTPGVYVYNVYACASGMTVPNCPTQRLTITVVDPLGGATPPPVANTDIATTAPATLVTLKTLENDKATAPGARLVPSTVQVTTSPANGAVSVNTDTGAISYTPNAGFVGVDTYVYQVCDSQTPAQCTSAIQQVTVADTSTNSTLAADDYAYTTVNVPVSGYVNRNDVDPQPNDVQTVVAATTQKTEGTLVLQSTGAYVFTPAEGFVGPVNFEYQTCDAGGACAKATLYILVGSLPEPQPDINATYVNQLVQGSVATNDGLPPGTSYGTPVIKTQPDGSTPVLTLKADGSYSFQADKPGVYVYDVPVCAAGQTSSCPTQTLTITVQAVAGSTLAPIANTDIAVTPKNVPVTLNTLSNDRATAPGASLVKVLLVGAPTSGTAAVNPTTGNITYTPATNFTGVATYTYQVCDNQTPEQCTQAVQKVTIVAPEADTVIAADDYAETTAGTPVSGNVLGNDVDSQGATHVLKATAQTTTLSGKGTLVLNEDGSFTFTPVKGFTGPVNFPYQVCDNQSPKNCASATIYILVAQAPVQSSAEPQAIPTLGEWAMIFMASLMAMIGVAVMRRRV